MCEMIMENSNILDKSYLEKRLRQLGYHFVNQQLKYNKEDDINFDEDRISHFQLLR